MQLVEVRRELQFNSELLVLIDTLKNIAGSQYHLLEKEKRLRFERFMQSFSHFFRLMSLADLDDPLVKETSNVLGVVVVTSDAGFMGGLNSGVVETALEQQRGRSPDDVHYMVVGEKGAMLFGDSKRPFKAFPGVTNETRYQRAVEVRDYIVQQVLEHRVGKVMAVYPRPLSFSRQVVEVTALLPCADLFEHAEVTARTRGRLATSRKVIMESTAKDMAEYLAGVWLTSKLYEAFEDGKLSEYAARAMHLEGSVQKLQKDNKKLKYQFFRAAHEHVDKGMRETFSSKKLKASKDRKAELREEAAERDEVL